MKIVLKILKILLVISTLIYPLFFNLLGGIAMISASGKIYGIFMILSSLLMLIAPILCFMKKNIASIIIQSIGFIDCMIVIIKYSSYADKIGASNLDFQPLSQIYFNRHFPTTIPFILLITIALIQFFSYDAIIMRNKKRKFKADRENQPAPKILDE